MSIQEKTNKKENLLNIYLSKEHENHMKDIEECFEGLKVKINPDLCRCSSNELPIQIIIFLGTSIMGGLVYDLFKSAIIKFYTKFKKSGVSVRLENGLLFSINKDLEVSAIVPWDKQDKFNKIKDIDDLINYIKNSTPGYKSTKLGLIPNDWEILKLGEIGEIITGKTPSTKISNFWNNNGYMFITPTDISEDNYGIYQIKTSRYITEEGKRYSGFVPENSLLITCIASIGKIAITKETSCFNQQINAIIPNKKFNYLFLYYQFQNNKKKLMSYAGKVAVPIINKSLFENLELFGIPTSHVEQQKIADILSSVDALINDTDTIISHQKKLKRGLLNKLMTEGIGHTDFVSHPKLGKLPKQWKVVKLGEIAEIIDGDRGNNYPKQTDFLENGFCLFLNAKNVTKSGFKFDECIFIDKEKDSQLRNGKLLRNDLILTTRGTIGNIAYYDSEIKYNNIRINSGMVILRTNKINTKFLYKIFNSFFLTEQIKKISFGSAQPQLTVKGIKNIVLLFPPLPEQQKIAEILGAVDADIEREQNYKATLLRLKHGLMQKLLTGKIRVKF